MRFFPRCATTHTRDTVVGRIGWGRGLKSGVQRAARGAMAAEVGILRVQGTSPPAVLVTA